MDLQNISLVGHRFTKNRGPTKISIFHGVDHEHGPVKLLVRDSSHLEEDQVKYQIRELQTDEQVEEGKAYKNEVFRNVISPGEVMDVHDPDVADIYLSEEDPKHNKARVSLTRKQEEYIREMALENGVSFEDYLGNLVDKGLHADRHEGVAA